MKWILSIKLFSYQCLLKDAKKENRLIEVQIRDKRLKCITEDKVDCIHVGFALALPEVRNALDK